MTIGYGDPGFTKVGPSESAQTGEGKRSKGETKEKKKDLLELVPGKPLPDRGACEHYRRSTRWLRFPCCGKAYPCDICHEKSGDGCPPGTWANRMICGLCSMEQGYSSKGCKFCSASFSKPSKSHWEGGQGCREKTKMSNKDKKKFSGSKYKTHSRKSERVGQKKS